MKRRTFAAIRSGLFQGKHYRKLGITIWLFEYMINRANWDDGIVYDYHDSDVADSLEICVRTIRDWRRKLQEDGYITCVQRQHSQEITIHNWMNPREYSGQVYNERPDIDLDEPDDDGQVFSDIQGDIQGDTQGDIQGDTQGSTQHVTLPYIKLTKNKGSYIAPENSGGQDIPVPSVSPSRKKSREPLPNAVKCFKAITGRNPPRVNYDRVASVLGDYPDGEKVKACFEEWCARGYKPTNLAWLDWYKDGIPPRLQSRNGSKPILNEPAGFDAIRQFRKEHGLDAKP